MLVQAYMQGVLGWFEGVWASLPFQFEQRNYWIHISSKCFHCNTENHKYVGAVGCLQSFFITIYQAFTQGMNVVRAASWPCYASPRYYTFALYSSHNPFVQSEFALTLHARSHALSISAHSVFCSPSLEQNCKLFIWKQFMESARQTKLLTPYNTNLHEKVFPTPPQVS